MGIHSLRYTKPKPSEADLPASQSSRPQPRIELAVFYGDMCVAKNTSQPANVRAKRVRCRGLLKTPQIKSACRKARALYYFPKPKPSEADSVWKRERKPSGVNCRTFGAAIEAKRFSFDQMAGNLMFL